jgi:hypothetical protein
VTQLAFLKADAPAMPPAATVSMTLPGAMVQRGFWLYVWRVEAPGGVLLYVGRTGDNSSPNAVAPYTRMGQHLGFQPTQNALRKHLQAKGVAPEDCAAFHLIAHGPILPEIAGDKSTSEARKVLMPSHKVPRNAVAAMEKALADDLAAAGYTVMNRVNCHAPLDTAAYATVRAGFAEHFPLLRERAE